MEDIPLHRDFEILVEIFDERGEKIDDYKFHRYYQLPHVQFKNINFSKTRARLFYPKEGQNLPAIIVLSGSDGRIEKAQNIAQLLANRGFVTLALSYFGLSGIPTHLDRIALETVEEGVHYLISLPQVDRNRIGLYGRSKGAEMALCAASVIPNFKCLVVNSPSCAVMEGLKRFKNSGHSSWTYKGKELPFTKFSLSDFIKGKVYGRPIVHYYKNSFISIEKVKAHLLMIGTKEDEIWPAVQSIEQLKRRWQSSYSSQEYELQTLILENSGHMLTVAYQPNNRYKKFAWQNLLADSQQSWQATLSFFSNYL
ncbi:alpha/beta hydrolase [Streptococcus dentapri]|uniref:Alpha/beta hydrolase n=1 Tax=Streptococcus dentapri TaxID=573564 RepID=A0ABV8D111_9STRE